MPRVEYQWGVDTLVVLVHRGGIHEVRGSIAGDTRTLMDVAENAELRSDPVLDFRQEVLAILDLNLLLPPGPTVM